MRRLHPSPASGIIFVIVSGAAQSRFRTPQAACVGSTFGSAGSRRNRFDRSDVWLGSVGARCACHRVPP
eukprot:6396755-Alexandrium_andersonii.AAC.1